MAIWWPMWRFTRRGAGRLQAPSGAAERMDAGPSRGSPTVSVIIPHYHDLAGLRLCLEALARQTYPRPFEIVVADNASPEGLDAVTQVAAGRGKVVLVTGAASGIGHDVSSRLSLGA